jgi:hypothetical protein
VRHPLKRCSSCKQLKPLCEFNNYKASPDGKDYRCRECAKEHSRLYRVNNPLKAKETVRKATIKNKFNITIEQYKQLLIKQNNKCAICDRSYFEYKKTTKREFCIDHNHQTGEIRGLLCSPCNRAIGQLQDNPNILRKAAFYLEGKKQ